MKGLLSTTPNIITINLSIPQNQINRVKKNIKKIKRKKIIQCFQGYKDEKITINNSFD
jgi:hypothetical protein